MAATAPPGHPNPPRRSWSAPSVGPAGAVSRGPAGGASALPFDPFDYLPRPVKFERVVTRAPPPPENPLQPTDPMAFAEACVTKAAISGVMGSGMGGLMGILMGSYQSISPPISLPSVPDPPKIPIRWQMIESWQSTLRKSRRWGRNFGAVGCVYAGIECVIEKARARHDIVNPVAGGCVTGAVLAARQGPMAMCFGCAGFAVFSGVIEMVMGS